VHGLVCKLADGVPCPGMCSLSVVCAVCCVLCAVFCQHQVCSEMYGLAPEVVVSGDMSARLPYLTSHLDYMVYELLKNSMRAGEEACF
jgi:hypothetical protein